MRGGGDRPGPTELPVLDVGIKYRLEEAEAAGEEVHQGRQSVQAHAEEDADAGAETGGCSAAAAGRKCCRQIVLQQEKIVAEVEAELEGGLIR